MDIVVITNNMQTAETISNRTGLPLRHSGITMDGAYWGIPTLPSSDEFTVITTQELSLDEAIEAARTAIDKRKRERMEIINALRGEFPAVTLKVIETKTDVSLLIQDGPAQQGLGLDDLEETCTRLRYTSWRVNIEALAVRAWPHLRLIVGDLPPMNRSSITSKPKLTMIWYADKMASGGEYWQGTEVELRWPLTEADFNKLDAMEREATKAALVGNFFCSRCHKAHSLDNLGIDIRAHRLCVSCVTPADRHEIQQIFAYSAD